MAPQSRQFIELDDFPGLITNMTGGEVPPAAAEICYNLICNRVGELTSRPGYLPIICEDDQ